MAQRPVLLLIPLVLDLFLWLGPRLSISPLASELAAQLRTISGGTTENSVTLFQKNTIEILGSYNLFSALSTWPLGTPSLLAGSDPGIGPLGPPLTIQVQTVEGLLALLPVLILAGLLIGALYLGLIARSIAEDAVGASIRMNHVWLYWLRLVVFVLVVLVVAFLVSVPFFLAVEIIAAFVAPVASLALLAGMAMGMWGLFHLFFATHGILFHEMGVRRAINNSVALVRQYRLSAVGLLLVAVVIGLGLSTIWNIPPSESWMRLIAIVGNAFINTGLATATFVYYRERTATQRARPGK